VRPSVDTTPNLIEGKKSYGCPLAPRLTMTAWRVTYLPAPTTETRRPFAVTVEDPDSPSLETFVSRLSGRALGVEWTQGRVIRSVEAFERYENRRRRLFLTALLTGLVAASVVTGFVLVGGCPFRRPLPSLLVRYTLHGRGV
jgi:hypothetical protein